MDALKQKYKAFFDSMSSEELKSFLEKAGAEFETVEPPAPDSMWLVIVESRHNVIRVCSSGKGFYIPGQEECWDFSHVSEWIEEVKVGETQGLIESLEWALGKLELKPFEWVSEENSKAHYLALERIK